MSAIAIISDFSFQIPTSGKSLKLIYVLSVLIIEAMIINIYVAMIS